MAIALGKESPAMYERADALLSEGKHISFIGLGDSMEPIIPDGTMCIVAPFKDFSLHKDIKVGDALMVRDYVMVKEGRRKKRVMVRHMHMVWMVKDHHVLIGSSMGEMFGWIPEKDILGKCIATEKAGSWHQVTDERV